MENHTNFDNNFDNLNQDSLYTLLLPIAEYKLILALVCRRWQALLETPAIKQIPPLTLKDLAKYGHLSPLMANIGNADNKPLIREASMYHRVDITIWLSHRGIKSVDYADQMLLGATRGGHMDLVKLALLQGARDIIGMMEQAAKGGHCDVFKLARQKGPPMVSKKISY